jgi:hypothetical protein
VGVADVLAALSKGQVEEVLLSTSLKQVAPEEERDLPWVEKSPSIVAGGDVSESILAQARQTGARARLIEDAPQLDAVGGVGASLRYRL